MARKMKVFAWQGHRSTARKESPNCNPQTREIMAASSMAEIGRKLGITPRSVEMTETGNQIEIQVAMAEPGVVFWQPISEHRQDPGAWRKEKESEATSKHRQHRLQPAVQAILDNAPRDTEQDMAYLGHLAAITNGSARGTVPIEPQGDHARDCFEAELEGELRRQERGCSCDPSQGDLCEGCEDLIDDIGADGTIWWGP